MSMTFEEMIFGRTTDLVDLNTIISEIKCKNFKTITNSFFKKPDNYFDLSARALSIVTAPVASVFVSAMYVLRAFVQASQIDNKNKPTVNDLIREEVSESLTISWSFLWFALISPLANLIDTVGTLLLKLKEDFTNTSSAKVSVS